MAVKTVNGVTTLTPTAWKWIVGAIFFLPFVPLSVVITPMFLLTATGKTQYMVLTPEGFTVRNHWKKTSYRWDEVSDFRLLKMKSSFITVSSMIHFTPRDKENTLLAKATKLLGGGTKAVTVVGMGAKDLTLLMTAYQNGFVPNDTAPNTSSQNPFSLDAKICPAIDHVNDSAPQRSKPVQHGKSKPVFGAQKTAMVGKVPLQQNPLVEDSGWRKRRAKTSPFG